MAPTPDSKPVRLLLATTNSGKLREVVAILAGLPVEFSTLREFPDAPPVVEDGDTFEANARKKALHYARHTGLLTLADDSGLEVDALDGAPGVRSARYAGENATDAENNAKLLARLAEVPPEQRTARFRCVIALATGTETLATAAGAFEGVIVDQPRGENGFGYDPLFFVEPFGMTSAQMPPELKNGVSHRANALHAIRSELEATLGNLPA